jgi:RNA polymerase sigma-32 factor
MLNTPDFVKTMHPLLSREDELVLFEQWQEARSAGNRRVENRLFQQIATQYSPIVKKLVKKMRGYGLDQNDMMSEALLALTRAALDFDPSKGFRFGTYANSCVINSLYTYVTKNYFMTNVCSNGKNKRLFFSLRRAMMEQARITGSAELSYELAATIAAGMEIEVETVLAMSALLRDPYSSLNQTLGNDPDGDELTRQDMLVSTEISQDDQMEEQELVVLHKDLIDAALASLDTRASDIVRAQVLTPEGERITLEELGERYHISKERARQIRDASLERIRAHIGKSLKDRQFTVRDVLPVS